MMIGLCACPTHGSGNVGDLLKTEASIDLIESILGHVDVDIYFKNEDFTSRLDLLNEADAILLFGFEIDNTELGKSEYPLVEDINAIETPIVPIGSSYRFFPADEAAIDNQIFSSNVVSFLNSICNYCPERKIPVRSNLVGRVLENNGYNSLLTGDPAWYDLDMIGDEFHRPTEIDRLVFTLPHFKLYSTQAQELLQRLSCEFPNAEKIVSRHATPSKYEKPMIQTARENGWDIHYASHDTEKLERYRKSDLHVGYRLHGHLAHLRWRRPSVILEEDSRAYGLTQTLGAGGITAYDPHPPMGLGKLGRSVDNTLPVRAVRMLVQEKGYQNTVPSLRRVAANPNPHAVEQTISLIEEQISKGWPAMDQIKEKFEKTYQDGMKPYLESAISVQ